MDEKKALKRTFGMRDLLENKGRKAGTHEELIGQDGYYRELVSGQYELRKA